MARENPSEVMPWVREHAQEMSEDVMAKHIALYVNDASLDIGPEGEAAVRELLKRRSALPGAEPAAGELFWK